MTLDELIERSDSAAYYGHALSQLVEAQRALFAQYALALHHNGAAKPLSWAHSEVRENIAQRARFYALKELWQSTSDVEGNLYAARDFDHAVEDMFREFSHAIFKARAQAFLQAYGRGLLNMIASVIDDGGCTRDSVGWLLV